VEQDGVGGACVRGTQFYWAWWETIPKMWVRLPVTLSPGDAIEAQVYYDKVKHRYEFTVSDLTDGDSATVWERCAAATCLNESAEVITEDPPHAVNPLSKHNLFADFTPVQFSDISITDAAGQRGSLSSGYWQTTPNVIYDGAGQRLGAPSLPSHGGTAFTNFWIRAYWAPGSYWNQQR